jgi:mannosyltransferase
MSWFLSSKKILNCKILPANTPPVRINKTSALYALVLFAIFAVSAYLRFYAIGAKTIWLDEAFSIFMGAKPAAEMLGLVVEIEKHPPLYYLLLHYWMRLGGDSAGWVRSLSALFGVFTIPLIYLAGKHFAGRTVGLLAALILAVNPLQVAFAQETRVYTLLTFAATFAIWMVARLLTETYASTRLIGTGLTALLRPNPTVRSLAVDLTWLGYIFSTAAVLYLHNTGFFFPFAVNLFMFGFILYRHFYKTEAGRFQPPSVKNWLIAQFGVVLLWIPWLGPFLSQSQDLEQGFWLPIPTWEIIFQTTQSLLIAFLPPSGWMSYAWIPAVLLAILGFITLRRHLPAAILLLILFFAPIVGQLLISLRVPIFYIRALIWVPIPFFVLMAAGFLQLRYRVLIGAAALILVVVNGSAVSNYYRYIEKERWDQAAAFVAQNLEKNDIIIFNAGWVQIPFDYYFRDYMLEVEKFGAPASLFEWGELEPIMQESDIPRLRSITADRKRVWLVYSHQWYTDPDRLVLTTLRQEFRLLYSEHFYEVDVYLFGAD